jgi:predicted nucleotidyltransferase
MNLISPTPYHDVNEILNLLFIDAKEILRDQFIGMYLFGSLANGDFDDYSDVDVLFVTYTDISNEMFDALKAMHEQITKLDSPWAIQLEVSYMPQKALRRYDPANNKHPHMDRGNGESLHIMGHDSDWVIQRYMLREHGIKITGPDLKILIDPIPQGDLRWAVSDILHTWLKGFLDNPDRFGRRGYQSYTVLTLCRILRTYKLGDVVSKPVAAEWAMKNLGKEWMPLIERALIGRQNPSLEIAPEDLNGTLDLIRYALQEVNPTPYPDVNEVLNLLLSNAKEILGDQFVGMYLYGSLSSGDFNPETSDIDFLFVTDGSLSEETIAKLEVMHDRTWATSLKRAGKLEGAYVPKGLIHRHNPSGAPCPIINEGRFYIEKLGSDWIIQRHVVREYGVVIEGPGPKTLIDFVTPDDIRGAVMGTLREWWFPMLDDPTWLRDGESGDRAFAIITMCRVLHALEHRTIVSKPKAIQWVHTKLGDPWKRLIGRAVAVSNHEEQDILLDETLSFIRFVKGYIVF